MSTHQPPHGRTNPPGNDSSESEDEYTTAEGRYRSRVKKYKSPAEFSTPSVYQKGEEVYVYNPGQRQPLGPYVIVEVLGKEQYRIKETASGRVHPKLVQGHSLLVKE
ncbi:hypothetical protein FN846DRAFT_448352 [Sphaerosporella brunnea]|uniref:Uncharacterized protein n=1 Tax=Sphaerosporella brunnea TaxID=1250544 RepID=A0A5J5F4N8_9PEZI|nr:hypothetical protein FN846DRAFT_448352 [Sphaerosporella brunnea]